MADQPPFLIYALPRSRTYWLSRYLTYGDWVCGHDELRHCRSMEDVQSWLSQPCIGSIETYAAPFWRLATHLRSVVIRRPVEQVVDSVLRFFPVDRDIFTRFIQRLDHKLDQIEHRIPNVLSVTFDDLNSEDTCKRVFEFCLPYRHDHNWWQTMSRVNLQINMHHMMRHFLAHQKQLEKLAKIAKHKIIAGMSRALVDVDHDDGFVFREETMANFDDARKLMEKHCVEAGEAPDYYCTEMNVPLLHQLEELGALQIMTARSNGRLFGYLVSIISPSVEAKDLLVATQNAFFVDPSVRGLGMRLQRAAVEALRERGVKEAYFRAGLRADGPRIGVLFRRMGAAPYGEWYKLDL